MVYFLFLTLLNEQFSAEEIYERTIVSEEIVSELKEKYKKSSYDDLFHPIREAAKSITFSSLTIVLSYISSAENCSFNKVKNKK